MHLIALVLAMQLAAEILPARLDQPTGPVRFEPEADKPDWEVLAKQKLGTAALEHPSATKLKQLSESHDLFDDAGIPFTAPLPAPLKAKKYYLISTRGVVPLTPDSFEGQVRYQFEPDATTPKVNAIFYMGEIVANLATKTDQTAGGFVFVSDQPLRFTSKSVDLSSFSVTRDSVIYVDQGVRRSARVESGVKGLEIQYASRLIVEPSREDYLFVQWKPDDSDCEFSFSLLKITGQTMEQVKWSAYNCDV